MIIDVLTLFKEYYQTLNIGIIGNAISNNLFKLNVTDIRDYSLDKHKKCDDYAYGGGAGMLMTPQPIYDAINACDKEHKAHRIYMSPKGKILNQERVIELSKKDNLLILSGSYEGVDERIIENYFDEELSIGDYILTNGDYPALVLINAVSRYIEGVLGSFESLVDESLNEYLLEYPQYTRPEIFNGFKVPEVLLSGDHKKIADWRLNEKIKITRQRRKDLYRKYLNSQKKIHNK